MCGKSGPQMGAPVKFVRLSMMAMVLLMATSAGTQNTVKPFHLNEATISDVHAAYKSGALTSVQLVQAYLDRIRAYDQAGPKLNVVIFLNPRALEEAAALDEHLRKTGKFVGPLHGIPVLVKSLEEIISSGRFHPNIGDNIRKAQSLELDDG